MTPNYEGLEADLYDEFWKDELDDESFCRELVASAGGRALEIACGTGRVLIPLRKAGLDIAGLDCSPRMLEICRRKAEKEGISVELHCCRMEDLDLPEQFDTIYIPAYSFQLVRPAAAADRALERFAQHLKPGGRLLLSVFVPSVEPEYEEGEWHLRKEVVRQSDGARVTCHQLNRFDIKTRTLHVQNRYQVFSSDGFLESTETGEMFIQWHDPDELATMLHDAGFKDVTIIGNDAPEEDGNAILQIIATTEET